MVSSKLLEWYSAYGWPIIRHLVSRTPRCRRCILSEKHGPLERGLCTECFAYEGTGIAAHAPDATDEQRARFDRRIRSLVNDRRYHALLMLSGGKDCTYTLYRLRTEYPDLRILCVTVNNGFMGPVALDSATLAAQTLQSDLLVSNDRVPEFARAFRQAFLDLNGRGSYGVVDYADGSLIFRIGLDIAKAMGIPVVLGGLSWVQVQRIVGKDDFEHDVPGEPLQVFPLAVWRIDEQEIRRLVRDKQLVVRGFDSPVASNNQLIITMSALDVLNLGYCSFEPEFAQLIREGKSDRTTWLYTFELLEFAAKRGFFNREIKDTLSHFGLTMDDVVKKTR